MDGFPALENGLAKIIAKYIQRYDSVQEPVTTETSAML
jgi:hypothetical protein